MRRDLRKGCHYCGGKQETWDHIVPKALGGKDGMYNRVRACKKCNSRKGAQWPSCGCAKCEKAKARALLARYAPSDPIPKEQP